MGLSVRAIQEIKRVEDGKAREVRKVHALAINMLAIQKAIEETNAEYIDKALYLELSGLLLKHEAHQKLIGRF